MSKITFSEKEIKILSQNKYVKKVSSKSISYSALFKEKFIEEYYKGKSPQTIFKEYGFDISLLELKELSNVLLDGRKHMKLTVCGLFKIKKNILEVDIIIF